MKSTLTKREKQQRLDWCIERMHEIRSDADRGTIPALVEINDLTKECDWLRK